MKNFCFLIFTLICLTSLSQNKKLYPDSTKKTYYSIVFDYPSTRGFPALIGVERCQKISSRLSFASSFNTLAYPIQHVGQPAPLFVVFCIQPFHLLIGKKQFKIETGISISYLNTNLNNSPFSNHLGYAGERFLYNIYLGLRFNFKKTPFHSHLAYVPYFDPTLHEKSNNPLFHTLGFEFGIGYIFHKLKHK